MTTAAQVRKLVQPLLDRSPDLAWVGRQIYVKPVHHFARTVLIDRILDPEGFRPQFAVVHLFESRTSFPLSWGEWLGKSSGPMPGSWRIQDPDVSAQLIDSIEQNALPVLRAMRTLEDYLAYVSGNYFRHHLYGWPSAKIIVDVALGDLDCARAICTEQGESWCDENPRVNGDEVKAQYARLCSLCGLLAANDRLGLVRLLHQWEAQTVKNFKIQHLWEPTPFPLELQSAK